MEVQWSLKKKLFSFIDHDCPPRLILPVLGKTNRHKFSVLYSSISNISFPRGFTNGKGQGQGWTVLSPKRQWQGQGWTVPGHCNLRLILWWDVTSKWRKRDFLVGCRAATAGVRDHCWPMQKNQGVHPGWVQRAVSRGLSDVHFSGCPVLHSAGNSQQPVELHWAPLGPPHSTFATGNSTWRKLTLGLT